MRAKHHNGIRLCFEPLESRLLLSADYFVANDGDNANPGTLAAPFRTIQHAASVMTAGDTAYIRGGIYRETVNVTAHDLTFESYNDEYVVVTGADLVAGWTQYSGDIYAADFGAIEPQFTQVFFDGARQQIARYSDNHTGNMLSIEDASGYTDVTVMPFDAQSGSAGAVFDTSPPGGDNHWVGGYFRAISGYTWANPTGLITASDGPSLTIDPITRLWEDGGVQPLGDGKGYILHLNALSTPGEWYYQNDTLYYWKPGGGAPSDTQVEAQRRESAFVIDGYDGLTLRSLHIKAANIELVDSNHNLIEDSTFTHLKGWFTRRGYGSSATQMGGVYVSGDNNTFDGCVFGHSWGNLLNFERGATNNTVTNSFFNDNGWMGMFTCAIANYGHNTTVTHSTFGSTGRFHIRTWDKINILHNDFYDAMNMGQDAGSIQAVEIDLLGSEFAYNTIRDMDALEAFERDKQFVVAFYMEGSSNYTAHHNLVYNVQTSSIPDGAFVYLGPRTVEIANALYYNNTVWNVDWRFRVWNRDHLGTVSNVQFKNNVFDSRMDDRMSGTPDLISQFILENNVESADPMLLFADDSSSNYQLADGSPAIDVGQLIPGITDGYIGGAPDVGAFEQGVAPWEYGVKRHTPLTGDFNLNGDVEGRDFLIWQRSHGVLSELNKWRANYGADVPVAATASIAAIERTTSESMASVVPHSHQDVAAAHDEAIIDAAMAYIRLSEIQQDESSRLATVIGHSVSEDSSRCKGKQCASDWHKRYSNESEDNSAMLREAETEFNSRATDDFEESFGDLDDWLFL